MAKHSSYVHFGVDRGHVVVRARASNSQQRVVVESDGTIINRLKFGQNTVEHYFALDKDLSFLDFELKNFSNKPGRNDFQVVGHAMVEGKVTFTPPVQSFMLRNLNTTQSAFDYGFNVRAGDTTIPFDPAVRNVGDPYALLNPQILAAVVGFVIGVVITLMTLAALQPAWLTGP